MEGRMSSTPKRWWVSWWHDNARYGAFELHSPWWTSGYGDGRVSICAAIIAEDEDAVLEIVYDAYDLRPSNIEFRFIDERPDDWAPWRIPKGTSRFQKAEWMVWPD